MSALLSFIRLPLQSYEIHTRTFTYPILLRL